MVKIRICLDPKNLNDAVKQLKYLIPNFEDISLKLLMEFILQCS